MNARSYTFINNYNISAKGIGTMQVIALHKLLIEELRDVYSAEKQLAKALPKVAKKTSSPRLQKAFAKYIAEIEKHVERLEQVFELFGEKVRAKKCMAVKGLLDGARNLMQEDREPDVRDAGLLLAAQKIGHYKMAIYGAARTYSTLLGNSKATKLLQKTLGEEEKADQALTQLAERVNVETANNNSDLGDLGATNRRSVSSDEIAPRAQKTAVGGKQQGRVASNAKTAGKHSMAKSKSRYKPASTRTTDNENYESMMAEGTATGTSRDTTGHDAQHALLTDAFPRNGDAGGDTDVERQS